MGTSVAMLRKIFLLLGLERNVYSCVLTDGLTSVIMPISCLWLTTLHLILSWAAYELYAGVGPICCCLLEEGQSKNGTCYICIFDFSFDIPLFKTCLAFASVERYSCASHGGDSANTRP